MVYRNLIILFAGLILSIFLLSGCQTYSEVETPSGTVPPSSQSSIIPPASSYNAQSATETSEFQQPLSRKAKEAQKVSKQDIISNFRNIYIANDSPRIAIFLNRTLSDEVRQWQTSERTVVSGEGEQVSAGTTNNNSGSTLNIQGDTVNIQSDAGGTGRAEVKGSTDKQRAITIESQQYIENEKRNGPEERWMWAFEDGALEPFLKAKANIIDRATILRLTAAKSNDGKEIQSVTPKLIEMKALRDHADIFVELLISRSTLDETGYKTNVNNTGSTPSEYDRFQRGVVVVKGSGGGIGTGFFITSEGHIITNKHVVDKAGKDISVKMIDGRILRGEVVQTSSERDLAIMKVSTDSPNWLNLANEGEYKTGTETIAIGTPVGLEWTVNKGIISAVREHKGVYYIQTDTPINVGNSGGPLISLETGNVIGINTLTVRKDIAEGLNFAVASDEVQRAFPSLQIPKGTVAIQSEGSPQGRDIALSSVADISSPYRYEFKASVKDIKNGRIIANVTSADWKGKRRRGHDRGTVIATEDGYQLSGGMTTLPAVKDVASELSIDVMAKLIEIWGE